MEAHLISGSRAPRRALKHVAGQKGTPFSQCVSAAAKLKAAKSGT
ncbi:MAG TPA: hypothetical protein VGN13_05030 [Solirubrobacteraceae bacterium]|jgi:hypothetical protein